jgi:hypothetical protein
MTAGSGVHPASYTTATRVPFHQGLSCWDMKLTAHLYLVPNFCMSGAITPLSHMPSWQIERHLYLLLIFPSGFVNVYPAITAVYMFSVYSMDSTNVTSKGGPVCTRKAYREWWGMTAHSRWRWVFSPIPLSGKEHLAHIEWSLRGS